MNYKEGALAHHLVEAKDFYLSGLEPFFFLTQENFYLKNVAIAKSICYNRSKVYFSISRR